MIKLKKLFRRLFKTKDKYINQKYNELCSELYAVEELDEMKEKDSEILYKQALQINEAKRLVINDLIKELRKRYYGE